MGPPRGSRSHAKELRRHVKARTASDQLRQTLLVHYRSDQLIKTFTALPAALAQLKKDLEVHVAAVVVRSPSRHYFCFERPHSPPDFRET